jgi:hypothetical protein
LRTPPLGGQRQALVVLPALEVVVEEVAVDGGLREKKRGKIVKNREV